MSTESSSAVSQASSANGEAGSSVDRGGPSGIRLWHVAGMLLAASVVGLAMYGLWPVLTGQAEDDAARGDVEAPSSTAEVDVIVTKRTDFPIRTQASGHLVPWQRARLHAKSSGQVTNRPIREGDRVTKGGLIVKLENREERIELEEARAQLLKARAEYRAKYGAVNRESGEAVPGDSSSGASRRATQAAASGLTAARQAVEKAKLNLERTRITAPFAGRVANLEVEDGQYVAQGGEVATVLQDRRMKVEVDVLEEDLVTLERGATAQVHVPALDSDGDSTAWVQGTVWSVNPQVRAESGTGTVTVAIPNPERRLVSGLHAQVRLETHRLSDRLVVPADAVLVRQGRDLVFIVEDGRAQWSYVEVGARSGEYVEIATGAQAGDTIAVGGHFALAHDAPVTIGEIRRFGLH